MQKLHWIGIALIGYVLSNSPAMASEPQAIENNEPLVMRIIFDDCIGFIKKDITPFEGLSLSPITPKGTDMLHAGRTGKGEKRHLFSDLYVVAWGQDNRTRYCILLTSRTSDEPAMLGVTRTGFLERLTKRADAVGMTENDLPASFSPFHNTSWREPDVNGNLGLRMSVMPTDSSEDQERVDAGLIIVAAEPYSEED